MELVINPAVFIPGFSFSCKIQTFRWLTSLKLHQKGHLKRRENEGRRLDIQVKGSQKKPHTKGRSLHTPIQLTYADCRPLPFFFLYSLQKYDMNAQKPNFPAYKAEKADAGPILSQPQAGSQYMDEHFQHRRDEYFKTIPLRYYISPTCLSLKCALRKRFKFNICPQR